MRYDNILELAKQLYEELQKAEEKYIIIDGRKEKIKSIEIITLKENKPTVPRFQIVTEKGSVLMFTPSQFLRRRYEIIQNGEKKTFIGA
ncbi:hypothetical protein AFV9_gp03 [Betalipothrixvirus uzonense]|uniref:Uncharacterized protein n=1 Tax=Betalipothrixvirus uzonense TaxID=512792 RepID=B2CRI0_9VIRU|nr:hypothetical protein AFV9_gp03 [Acidianus filamentous virus 9]ACB37237.1 hypothetical protein [Acidianus filamentous virus 9]